MLDMFLSFMALVLSAALFIPAVIFSVECVAAVLLRSKQIHRNTGVRPSIAILVPAHNEESGISETLLSIKAQMCAGDRLIVVADNCIDGTALLARAAGAEVVERNDENHRGKGFALHAGVMYLAANAPDIVVVVDADCFLSRDTLDRLAEKVSMTGAPVQACYLMTSPSATRLDLAIREFAFLVKNLVRPLGMSKLGLPCQLTGSGMAFPWAVLNKADLSNGNIVEDMKLGVDLAFLGYAPSFCESAMVASYFPQSSAGTVTQYRRWESGHLAMIGTALGALFKPGVAVKLSLATMLLDITVPPLALFVFILTMALGICAILAVFGFAIYAFVLALINILLVTMGITIAWFAYGAEILPLRKLYGVPRYVSQKVEFYLRMVLGERVRGWVRTDRQRE